MGKRTRKIKNKKRKNQSINRIIKRKNNNQTHDKIQHTKRQQNHRNIIKSITQRERAKQ